MIESLSFTTSDLIFKVIASLYFPFLGNWGNEIAAVIQKVTQS